MAFYKEREAIGIENHFIFIQCDKVSICKLTGPLYLAMATKPFHSIINFSLCKQFICVIVS